MSITADLEQILSARYGEEVRQAIHDSIEEGYNIAVQAQGTAETSADSAEAYATAALASEQAAQGYMELAEQYKNEAFSGTPTGYADLVAKVNSIYKQTASTFGGVDTVEGLALAHTIYGMSEQDGTPTPSVPVDIDSAVANFNCVGKNLYDVSYWNSNRVNVQITSTVDADNQTLTFDGTASGGGAHPVALTNRRFIRCNVGDTLTFKVVVVSGSATIDSLTAGPYINQSGGNITAAWGKYSISEGDTATNTVTITSNMLNSDGFLYIGGIQIYTHTGDVYNNFSIRVMITLNNTTALDWVPYQSKTITTGLTLRAIEVQSTDDYNLVKDGKYYIADTLDWDEDSGYRITRRIGHDTITTCIWYADRGNGIKQINASLPSSTTSGNKYYVLASNFKATGTASYIDGNVYIGGDSFNILVMLLTDVSITSIETGTTWLTNNPVEVQYVLATPTTEAVTSAQAQALLGLKTYDEATSIDATGDVAPSVTLEYSKNRATALGLMSHNLAHINALKIADLS